MDFSIGDIPTIARMVVGVAFGVPLMVAMFSMSLQASITHQVHVTAMTDLIVDAVTPWWIGIFEAIAAVSSIGAVCFILFLKWTGTWDS